MVDIIFIASLFLGFTSIKLFANWCEKQVVKK